jgi:hypothetical protein
MRVKRVSSAALILSTAVAALVAAGCGGPSSSEVAPAASVTPTDPAAEAAQAEAQRAAELQAKEAELAKREALAAREQELARREAGVAAREKAAKTAAGAPRKASTTTKPAATVAAAPKAAAKAARAHKPILVPAGTELSIGLSSPLSTKSAAIGDPVDARLASDLVINGRRAILAGAPVRGRVTDVVSGSKRIGGTPTLALAFDGIELEDGATVAISGQVVQQGKSDTARDTAKIVGGAAAGAVIGHQVDDDKGTVIGGLLGGAAGAIAARKTGTEIEVPAGTVMAFVVDQPFKVLPN